MKEDIVRTQGYRLGAPSSRDLLSFAQLPLADLHGSVSAHRSQSNDDLLSITHPLVNKDLLCHRSTVNSSATDDRRSHEVPVITTTSAGTSSNRDLSWTLNLVDHCRPVVRISPDSEFESDSCSDTPPSSLSPDSTPSSSHFSSVASTVFSRSTSQSSEGSLTSSVCSLCFSENNFQIGSNDDQQGLPVTSANRDHLHHHFRASRRNLLTSDQASLDLIPDEAAFRPPEPYEAKCDSGNQILRPVNRTHLSPSLTFTDSTTLGTS
ncbi:unnamed protein product, partial [Protopolystoma xenopodis]